MLFELQHFIYEMVLIGFFNILALFKNLNLMESLVTFFVCVALDKCHGKGVY